MGQALASLSVAAAFSSLAGEDGGRPPRADVPGATWRRRGSGPGLAEAHGRVGGLGTEPGCWDPLSCLWGWVGRPAGSVPSLSRYMEVLEIASS